MKQFFDKDFWKNTAGCTVGTLIGILLTFGTSSYLENRSKTEMGTENRDAYFAQPGCIHPKYADAFG